MTPERLTEIEKLVKGFVGDIPGLLGKATLELLDETKRLQGRASINAKVMTQAADNMVEMRAEIERLRAQNEHLKRTTTTITDNWDYRLTVSIYADDPEDIANLLLEIAKRIKHGRKIGLESYCAGTYEFTLEETPVEVEDEE